ncbi:MAG: riboflavin kinase, partial [Candidatus Omnitrophota bacterium]
FGHGGAGDVSLLKALGKECDFTVREIRPLRRGKTTISSTVIRQAISQGRLDLARGYLGRALSVRGRVVRGKGMGRMLGYRTANVDTGSEIIPPAGIYAARVKTGLKGRMRTAAVYIGQSPTLRLGYRRPRLEVHIPGFYRNIYGREVEIEFIRMIRGEKRFSRLADLSAQIKEDNEKIIGIVQNMV